MANSYKRFSLYCGLSNSSKTLYIFMEIPSETENKIESGMIPYSQLWWKCVAAAKQCGLLHMCIGPHIYTYISFLPTNIYMQINIS
jgi:hypothetical protein